MKGSEAEGHKGKNDAAWRACEIYEGQIFTGKSIPRMGNPRFCAEPGKSDSVQSGMPNCKMIVLESLMDESAFPWQADCEEGNGRDHQHIVRYLGALYQALLDVSDWVERGIAPAESSVYRRVYTRR